jgi:hypothetical protein
MALKLSKETDLICILYGCSFTVDLRRREVGETYTLITECYGNGHMNGEPLTMAKDIQKLPSELLDLDEDEKLGRSFSCSVIIHYQKCLQGVISFSHVSPCWEFNGAARCDNG